MDWIYLDNNATTKPVPQVAAAVTEAHQTLWANPSSVHRLGQQVRQRLELARQSTAKLIGAKPRELVFTSGGTEAANLAIGGLLHADRASTTDLAMVTTRIEHSAVREPADALASAKAEPVHVEYAAVDEAGQVTAAAVEQALNQAISALDKPRDHDSLSTRASASTTASESNSANCSRSASPNDAAAGPALVLVSIQWANNETGVIQPIESIARAIDHARQRVREASAKRRVKIYFHVDATQAVGKIPVDVKHSGADLLSFAAHKFHGPKGIGVLWRRTGVRLQPRQLGGPQERELRGGTENTAGIIGLGVAADLAGEFLANPTQRNTLESMRDRFEAQIIERLANTRINSPPPTPRLWNTSNLAFAGLEAEAILLGLSEKGLCASAGAACSSGSLDPSPVLRAMGVDEPAAHGSVRFSLSRQTTDDEIDQAVQIVCPVVENLSATMPVSA